MVVAPCLEELGPPLLKVWRLARVVPWHTGLLMPVLGPRTIQHETVASEAAAAAPAPPVMNADACSIHSKAFQDCLNNYGSEISKCQFYLDMLNECRRGGVSA
uniref:p8MTCP1 n=1 Tax=Zea mays TaxID=4577 RepID=B6T1P5_MAIZE|nr:p8MTCP1 [Zea mays]